MIDLAERRELRKQTLGLKNPTGGHSFPHLLEVAGEMYRVRMPRPEALHSLTSAVSPHVKNTKIQNDMIQLFVASHMDSDDFERVLYRMIDPDDTFTKVELTQLMRGITTLGTARPTLPS